MYSYGIIFYSYDLDDEICVIFTADNYFFAVNKVKDIELTGYAKSDVTYIDDRNKSYYTVTLEELKQHPSYMEKIIEKEK